LLTQTERDLSQVGI